MSPTADKTCPRCNQTKPVTGFWRDRTAPDGRCYVCIDCRRAEHPPGIGGGLTYDHAGCGGTLVPEPDHAGMVASYDWYRCTLCRQPGYLSA